MYGDMAALARISVTDEAGNLFTVRARDVKRAYKSKEKIGYTTLQMDDGDMFFVSESATAVHNALDVLWDEWLAAFPA
jgi:hypothetical protein